MRDNAWGWIATKRKTILVVTTCLFVEKQCQTILHSSQYEVFNSVNSLSCKHCWVLGRSTESIAPLKGLTKELNPVDSVQPKQKKQVLRKKDARTERATKDTKVDHRNTRLSLYCAVVVATQSFCMLVLCLI